MVLMTMSACREKDYTGLNSVIQTAIMVIPLLIMSLV